MDIVNYRPPDDRSLVSLSTGASGAGIFIKLSHHWTPRSEPMQLNRGVRNTILSEEREYLGSLIALKLQHLSHLFVVH
jgi:hypothetical protein